MNIEEVKDRAIGAFIGLAVGDAVGTTVEFKEPGEFTPLTDMIGGGVFRLNPGEWTDDTSMALCLADVIIEHGTVNPYELMIKFARWYNFGENSSNGKCFDIGTTCVSAITAFQRRKSYEPAPDLHYASGNGSIMRLSPVAVRWALDRPQAIAMAALQGETTHGSKACRAACETLAGALVDLITGYDPALDDKTSLAVQQIPNTGFVDHTMLAATWAFQTTTNFSECILKAANLGGDADTIAAVAGQLAGAKYGLSGIPNGWLNKLAMKDHLLDLANKLFAANE
jgi:ADP-ribosyl-[dinitrogen reductase] hydrolase